MDFATLFAWFVMGLLSLVVVSAIVGLGSLPGLVAKSRCHPHAEAINVASWIGLACGGILWPFALIWAYLPFSSTSTSNRSEVDQLRQHVAELEAELATMKAATTHTSS